MKFINNYNFIPFSPRRSQSKASGLSDGAPAGHSVWKQDRLTGHIDLKLTLSTPMLLPESGAYANDDEGEQTSEPLVKVMLRNGQPWIPPSSLKGAVRSAFECVTNSRVPRFDQHGKRLGYRSKTRLPENEQVVPAMIVQQSGDDERFFVQPMWGCQSDRLSDVEGLPRSAKIREAAWIPMYHAGSAGPSSLVNWTTTSLGRQPTHGEKLMAKLRLYKYRSIKGPQFNFWSVVDLAQEDNGLDPAKGLGDRKSGNVRAYKTRDGSPKDVVVFGRVFRSNQNTGRKHDERLFFSLKQSDPNKREFIGVEPETWKHLEQSWNALISDYLACHKEDDLGSATYRSLDGSTLEWSAHLRKRNRQTLQDGSLCYAHIRNSDELVSLIPVELSRNLYSRSPWDLLPQDARPATCHAEFSPADRVFGWVHQSRPKGEQRTETNAPYRGHLIFGQVDCISKTQDAVKEFTNKPWMNALNTPKPRQPLFYVGENNGSSLSIARGTPDFSENRMLRGRKVYLHQNGKPDAVWSEEANGRKPFQNTQGKNHYPEHLHPEKKPGNTNLLSRLSSWVTAGTSFKTRIHFDNLHAQELGALLYVLDGKAGDDTNPAHLKLGGGKPFGLGSARTHVKSLKAHYGDAVVERYKSLSPRDDAQQNVRSKDQLIDDFLNASKLMYPGVAQHLEAYRVASVGDPGGRPVHYPREHDAPQRPSDRNKEGFRWFQKNDKSRNPKPLPSLKDRDFGLPYNPSE